MASPAIARRLARATAWTRAGEPEAAHAAIRSFVLAGAPVACAAELIEIAALARLAGLDVGGLTGVAKVAAERLSNPGARTLLETDDIVEARRTFLHWDV